jgi:alpha-beta hydrolase superfamily lysophospholipase
VTHLRTDFRCIGYDLRGHGKSPMAPVPFTLDDLVDDLEAAAQRMADEMGTFDAELGPQRP